MSFLYRKLGALESPVQGDATTTTLVSLDPGRDQLLSFFKDVLNAELGHSTSDVLDTSIWYYARQGTALAGRMPVADVLPEVPDRETLRQLDLTFPWLSVYRTTSEELQHTLYHESTVQQWGLDYVLGPLSAPDVRRLRDVLEAAKKFIRLAIKARAHAAHQDGALQFFEGSGSFSSIRVVSTAQGAAEFGQQGEGLIFHSLHMDLETVELDGDAAGAPAPGAAPFEGVSMNVHVGGGEQGVKRDALELRTEPVIQNPFIHGVSNPDD